MSYVSHADVGGKPGFGPINPDPHEPLFHAPWERKSLALALAMGVTGQWNIDLSRSARETLPTYLQQSYYEIWANALAKLLIDRGLLSEAELAAHKPLGTVQPLPKKLWAADVPGVLARGGPTARPHSAPAQFALGQRVRAQPIAHGGHTRLPRYVWGKVGTVTQLHGAHVYADRHAIRRDAPFDDSPEWLYGVSFDGAELWGDVAEPQSSMSVDIWEPHLVAVAV
jgi:nitrile hydratase subunit beta